MAVVAHLDTVFPEGTDVTVRREGDKLMAPGIADDTRGLVTLLTIVRLMDRHGLDTADDVLFVGSVGEEGIGDLRGVKHLFRDGGPEINAFVAIDGTSNTRVRAPRDRFAPVPGPFPRPGGPFVGRLRARQPRSRDGAGDQAVR